MHHWKIDLKVFSSKLFVESHHCWDLYKDALGCARYFVIIQSIKTHTHTVIAAAQQITLLQMQYRVEFVFALLLHYDPIL